MRALLFAALVLLAGCAGPFGAEAPLTPSGPCTEASKPTPTDGPEVEAATYPDPPPAWTTESVRRYAEAYESALLRNEALAGGNLTYLEVYVQDLTVSHRGSVYVVRLQSYTNGGAYEQSGEGTPYVVHWDDVPTPASYLVTSDRLVRAESGDEEHVSPEQLRNGTTLECF